MKIVYISGPYIGGGTKAVIEKNIQIAKEYAKALANRKIGFFSPHLNDVGIDTNDISEAQRFFLEQDAEFEIRSDAIIFIPGYENAFGCKYEEKIAIELGLPRFYPKSPEDLDEVEKWYLKDEDSKETVKQTIDWDKVVELRRAMSKYTFAA